MPSATSAAPSAPTSLKFDDLRAELDRVRPPGITFIMGAGVSKALTTRGPASPTCTVAQRFDRTSRVATWSGLVAKLFETLEELDRKDFGGRLRPQIQKAKDVDPGADGIIASIYLLARLFHQLKCDWRDEVAKEMLDLDFLCQEMDRLHPTPASHACTRWRQFLAELGVKCRSTCGRVAPVTTNFDHLIALYTGLPIYVPQWSRCPYAAAVDEHWPASSSDGFIVSHGLLKDVVATRRLGDLSHVGKLRSSRLASLHRFSPHCARRMRERWQAAAADRWLPDSGDAGVLHVHGSSLVPQSLIFTPGTYERMQNDSPLEKTFREAMTGGGGAGRAPGYVIFVGCQGTLFDPHFLEYWRGDVAPPAVIGMAASKENEAASVADQFNKLRLHSAPRICEYGQWEDLPARLMELLKCVD